jgi:transposase
MNGTSVGTDGLVGGNKDTYRYRVTLDVHDGNTYVFAVDILTGNVLFDNDVLGPVRNAVRCIERLKIGKDALVLYESGSCGFFPYRLLEKAGFHCKVIASSSIPRTGSGKRKTDRTDAHNNFHDHLSGRLRYVHVPTAIEVADREVLRYRYGVVRSLAEHKQRTVSFCKRNGLLFELTKKNWTVAHRRWLKSVEAADSVRFVLNSHIEELERLELQVGKAEQCLDKLFSANARYQGLLELYCQLPGFGRVNAMTMVLEGQDLGRFAHPNALMSYTGLIPGKRSSGTKNPAISLTKEGNRFMRTALVNAAGNYRDCRIGYSKKELEAMQDPLLKDFMTRMQERLRSRYRHLRSVGKHSNKVKCAVARELAGFVWELATRLAPQLEQYRIAA